MHSEWPIISVRLEIIYERTFRTDVSSCPRHRPVFDENLSRPIYEFNPLDARLSIFGSMIAECYYSFDFLLSL